MKVLHVLNELKPSGAETMLRCAAPHWHEHGIECELLATGASEGEYADVLRDSGYPVHHLPRKRGFSYFAAYRAFLRRGGYQVVHQHAESASYWMGLAAFSAGAGLVRTVHNNFAFDGNLRWRRALQRRHLQRLGVTHVAIAPGVQRNELERFGVHSHLILNWVDVVRFTPVSPAERAQARARWAFRDDDLVLVTLGNCSRVKNHGVLIDALARTADLAHLKYLHVGLEDDARSERAQAERLGVADRIRFCGWMPEAREALAAADLYVMPSLYEGFSIAALEALGVGLPALLARVNGLRDLGLLFPGLIFAEPECDALASTLRGFAALDPAHRHGLSADYSERVQTRFSPARGVREYVAVYEAALQSRASRVRTVNPTGSPN